jgi:hypothetical protein
MLSEGVEPAAGRQIARGTTCGTAFALPKLVGPTLQPDANVGVGAQSTMTENVGHCIGRQRDTRRTAPRINVLVAFAKAGRRGVAGSVELACLFYGSPGASVGSGDRPAVKSNVPPQIGWRQMAALMYVVLAGILPKSRSKGRRAVTDGRQSYLNHQTFAARIISRLPVRSAIVVGFCASKSAWSTRT